MDELHEEGSVFEGIMQGLLEAIAYAEGDESTCSVTLISDTEFES